MGSRLNLYCSAGRRRRGRASVRVGISGGKGRSSESRRRNIVREGARVASGEPARAIEGANRPFVARGFSSVGYAKSGWGALTVSWLRSLVHHLWVFVGCSQFFLLRA